MKTECRYNSSRIVTFLGTLSVPGLLPALGNPSLQTLTEPLFWSWVLGTWRTGTRGQQPWEQGCSGCQEAGEGHLGQVVGREGRCRSWPGEGQVRAAVTPSGRRDAVRCKGAF